MSNADFTSGLDALARALNDSLRDETELSKLFEANNIKLKDRNGKLISVNEALARGADLMRNAASEQDKIKIAEMLGLTRSWVGVLGNGAAAFNATAEEARAAGAVIDKSIIEKAKHFDSEWTKATAKWTATVKAGAAEILPDLIKLANAAIEVVKSLSDYSRQTMIAAKLNDGMALSVKELGEAITLAKSKGSPIDPSWIAEYDRLLELQREAHRGRRATGNEPVVPPPASEGPKTVIPAVKTEKDADVFTRAQDAAKKRIALLEADTLAVGQNESARERLRTIAELEQAAMKANRDAGLADIAVTKEQRAEIDKLGDATLAAAAKQEQAKRSFEAINQTVQHFGNLGIDVFDRLAMGGEKFADVLEDLRRMMIKAAMQAAILGEGPLANLFGTKSTVAGGTGGILGAILGGGGTVDAPNQFAAAFPTPFAEGGYTGHGGKYQPAGVVHKGEYVFDQESVKRLGVNNLSLLHRGYANGGLVSGITPTAPRPLSAGGNFQTNNITVTVNGSAGSPEQNSDLAERIGKQMRTEMEAVATMAMRKQMRPGGMFNAR
jgi:hypothetical protein